MKSVLQPWQLLLMCLAGWLQREQRKVIEFYQAELDAMMQAQGKKRSRITTSNSRNPSSKPLNSSYKKGLLGRAMVNRIGGFDAEVGSANGT